MFSVHRKQTPFVVVGSLKIYENLRDLGWYRRRLCGDFPTVFLYEVGACADPGIFVPENSSDNFFSPQLYRGCPMVISKKLYMYIFFLFLFFFWGGGGPNANFYRNPYSLWFSRGVRTPNPLWIRMGRLCVFTCPSSEPSLLANATSTRMRLVSRDACNEQMINCNCTHQSSSSQAKGTNSTSFLELVPLACEDDQSFENHRHIWTCSWNFCSYRLHLPTN